MKQRHAKSGHQFCGDAIRWCESHERLPNRLGDKHQYDAWPVLIDDAGVTLYMNQYGYGMNGHGVPHHPIADMLGLWAR